MDNRTVEEQIKNAKEAVSQGKGFYDSVKEAGLFSGFELQLIRVGSRARCQWRFQCTVVLT